MKIFVHLFKYRSGFFLQILTPRFTRYIRGMNMQTLAKKRFKSKVLEIRRRPQAKNVRNFFFCQNDVEISAEISTGEEISAHFRENSGFWY